MRQQLANKTPVTILTGFLGAGKTTLLNHILTEKHGIKIAVIENEFGEVGVDQHLVKQNIYSEEQIIQTMNGCICCTVRGDLSKIIKKLLVKQKRVFDAIIIETTGMANPTPLVQTFFLEEEIEALCQLDGIITVVDAKHIMQHLNQEGQGTENQSIQQIAFADRIILNKIDLVKSGDIQKIKGEIEKINQTAQIIEATYSRIDPNILIGIKTFDLKNVLKVKPNLLKGQRVSHRKTFNIEEQNNQQNQSHGHGHGHDHENQNHGQEHHGHQHHNEKHGHNTYLHKKTVSSCGCIIDEPINLARFNQWMDNLISQKSADLYRYKGVINVAGANHPYVFQGVHQVFTGHFIKNGWEETKDRQTSFCFIGKNLEKESLIQGVKHCIAHQLQYEEGDIVQCRVACGPNGWKEGTIIDLWHQGYPYLVQLENGGNIPFSDELSGRIKLVRKGQAPSAEYKQSKGLIFEKSDNLKAKGLQQFHLQKYQQALNYFNMAIENIIQNVSSIDKSHLEMKILYNKVYKQKIICQIRLNKSEQAIKSSQHLLEKTPKDSNLHYLYALCLINMRRFDDALEQLEVAYDLDEDNEDLMKKIRQCHRIIHQQQIKMKAEKNEGSNKLQQQEMK